MIPAIRVCALAMVILMAWTTPASAAITWNWSFASEQGQFVTDGDLVGDNAPAGTYNVTDFAVSQSAVGSIGSISGGQYSEGSQVGNGFIWNGTVATQFFRAGGQFTNGSNFFDAANLLFFGFFIPGPGDQSGQVIQIGTSDTIIPPAPLTLTPIPEPAAAVLSMMGFTVLLGGRRCRRCG